MERTTAHHIATAHKALSRKGWRALCVVAFVLAACSLSPKAMAQVDADMVTIMGRNALSVDDYLTAIRYFNQAIEAKPFLSRPYYYRAYAKFTLEDYRGAELDCSKSLELNPFITEVYQLRGLCRIHNDNYSGAADDYTRTLKDLPEDQGSRYNRALCYLQLKDYAAADSDLNVLIRRWPKFTRTYLVKAQSLFEQKDTLTGIAWLDRLLAQTPNDAQAWGVKGRFALQKDSFALADSCLTRAINAQPSDFENYVARAQARHALGHFGLAIADYSRTIELVPEHFVAHYNRGLIRSFTGDLNRAIEDFDFVISKEPDNTLAIYNRAQLRAKVGNYRGAAADYSRLIKEYPNFTYGYLARAECRRKMGDVRGAVADETFVAKKNLDVAYGRARRSKAKKVRLRSEHELEQYQQIVQEDPDTTRNVFGTLYGKVQNDKVSDELLPMFALAFAPVYERGYHSVGFLPEVERMNHANTSTRRLCLTAEAEASASTLADQDALRVERSEAQMTALERLLTLSAVHAMRYDYTSALNAAGEAVRTDSSSVAALLQRAFVLSRSLRTGTLDGHDVKARTDLAFSDLDRASRLAPQNAFVAYNRACLLAQAGVAAEAIEGFTHAITLDGRMPEAYYNRAILRLRSGETEGARADFSQAGQLGLYKAYAQLKQSTAKKN